MFSRYTQEAQRAIFFARHEVGTTGGHQIDTEHLLLGLMQADSGLFRRLVDSSSSMETICQQVRETAQQGGGHLPTSVDLPLSSDCKSILALAADEAELLHHR